MSDLPQRLHGQLRPALALALGLGAALPLAVLAQQATPAPAATSSTPETPAYATGDPWIDDRLADIDRFAAHYPDAFVAELERYAGASPAYVRALRLQPRWTAGDVWFACFLARATGGDCRELVRARSQAGAQAGWQQLAEGLDAGPGTQAYSDLRLALADSYGRWARPLQPDPALRRALRQRDASKP